MTVKLIPYLNMEGNAREAIQFYQQALDAEVLSLLLMEKCQICLILLLMT